MSRHLVMLSGCRSDVLAHYLKALAVFRLVAEQKDPAARGFWRDGSFQLLSSLDATALTTFLLHEYVPTPIVAPWNGGSGFFPNDDATALNAIAGAKAARLRRFGEVIGCARALTTGLVTSPKQEAKRLLIERARREWPAPALAWLDAALAITDDTVRYPALLGTGGNDGRLDFTNNFMQRLTELVDVETGAPRAASASLLDAALFGSAVDVLQKDVAIGQFLPGSAGGANATAGYDAASMVNGWDFVLALEGAVAFQVAVVRRLDGRDLPQAAAPFAVRPAGAGYASATESDESARGEQWLPIWSAPAAWTELESVIHEARLLFSGQAAMSAVEAAAAVAQAGAVRGVNAFQRFGFIERNGQANLAVPLGAWPVAPAAPPSVPLVDVIADWVDRLRYAASQASAPAGVAAFCRRIQAAILQALRQPVATRLEQVVSLLARAEDQIIRSSRWAVEARLRPLPQVPEEALTLLLRGAPEDPELCIARAVASLHAPDGWALRRSCVPLDDYGERFAATTERLLVTPDHVWRSTRLVDSMNAVLLRRRLVAVRAERRAEERETDKSSDRFPVRARHTVPLRFVQQFLDDQLDLNRLARLVRALMNVEWQSLREQPPERAPQSVSTLYALTRLAWNAVPPRTDSSYRADARVPGLLGRGQGLAAGRVAIARLRASGVVPRVRAEHLEDVGNAQSKRIGAALLIPISAKATRQLTESIVVSWRDRSSTPQHHEEASQ